MTEKSLALMNHIGAEIDYANREVVDFIKLKYAPEATDMELTEFLVQCKLNDANPARSEIYFIKYKGSAAGSIQYSINWMVRKANESGMFAGFTLPEFRDINGVWHKDVWDYPDGKNKFPTHCKIGVIRKDYPEPVYGIVSWKERFKDQSQWKADKQPIHMIVKCAKAEALRGTGIKGITGIYITEEMHRDTPDGEWVPDPSKSNVDNAVEAGRAAKKREAEKQRFRNQGDLRDHDDIEIGETEQKRINAQIKSLGIDRKEIVGRINGVLKVLDLESVKKLSEITHKQAAALIEAWDVELTEIENGMFKEEDSK